MKKQNPTHRTTRSGFTLLELLAVITIIAILLALILPAMSGVLRNARNAEVSVELTKIEQALTTFREKFGEYPPSYLQIPAQGDAWSPASFAVIKKFWPQFNFATNGGLGNSIAIEMNGAECLVFFLGGVESGTVAAPVHSGFSSNPLSPWMPSGNPIGPFLEFDANRISDVDGDGIFEYRDTLPSQTAPILYLSAGDGSMNKDNDAVSDDFDVYDDAVQVLGNLTSRNMSFPYLQASGQPYKSGSFQLISPGEDGEYGPGGFYGPDVELNDSDTNTNGILEFIDVNSDGVLEPTDILEPRRVERDNITNFAGGTLN